MNDDGGGKRGDWGGCPVRLEPRGIHWGRGVERYLGLHPRAARALATGLGKDLDGQRQWAATIATWQRPSTPSPDVAHEAVIEEDGVLGDDSHWFAQGLQSRQQRQKVRACCAERAQRWRTEAHVHAHGLQASPPWCMGSWIHLWAKPLGWRRRGGGWHVGLGKGRPLPASPRPSNPWCPLRSAPQHPSSRRTSGWGAWGWCSCLCGGRCSVQVCWRGARSDLSPACWWTDTGQGACYVVAHGTPSSS